MRSQTTTATVEKLLDLVPASDSTPLRSPGRRPASGNPDYLCMAGELLPADRSDPLVRVILVEI